MREKITHLVPMSVEPPGDNWPDELKIILASLVDLAAKVLQSNNSTKLFLNEVVNAEELSARLKVPSSTIEELARTGKLKGAFKVGRHWRFDMDVLRGTLPTTGEEES